MAMRFAILLVTAVVISAPAYADAGTLAAPDPAWFALGVLMTCVATLIAARAVRRDRGQSGEAAGPAVEAGSSEG